MAKPPVLQKKDQKKTLSAQKGKKVVIKNVLADPFDKYFPEINQFEAASVLDFVKQLPALKSSTKVPWSSIKSIPKESRKAFRAEQCTNFTPPNPELKSNLNFGVNKITRLLESDSCPASVLITADVNPRYMVKHVIDLCILKKVHVLAVPKLKEALATSTGISTIALALNQVQQFNAINEKVKKISANYPVPEKHAHFAEDEESEELEESVVEDEEMVVKQDFHLIRANSKVRMFIPEASKVKTDADSSDFFSFGDQKSGIKTKYNGLKVKCIRKNPNRPKKFKPLM